MPTLLSFDLAERRALASGTFAPLVHALRTELTPLLNGALPIPAQKARLTRRGGRCALDGTYLAFDPFSPHEHRCAQCQRVYVDRTHDDWWAMGAQLWTAERAVQAAALNLVTDDRACASLSIRILGELSDRYTTWPNKDNALGPTRPFFSTYLESIWLLNLCHAIALLEQGELGGTAKSTLASVRANLIQPSRDLIAGFHEGKSNRQVWNEVAILSASQILGDEATIAKRLDTESGLISQFAGGLLSDGTWYEGENYHLFAHRGLWYGVQLLRALGRELPGELESRYRAGFVTPFLGLLPDDTLPSRRDSQYKVSIRQWRFAEWCELGIAHSMRENVPVDERLAGMLHRLYHADPNLHLESQHRHAFSTADAERNEPAGLLARGDLSWRALLMSPAEIPAAENWSASSVCLPRQGLAVLRRDHGSVYIALEGGHTGGGHGHPDRLALTVQQNHSRWLEDPGTGSYVDPSLYWYRSTLAHAAPLIDGASQDAVPARLLAFDDRGAAGWICKRVENVKPGVNITRTVVAGEGYLIDVLDWDADRDVQIDLPIARDLSSIRIGEWQHADPGGAGGLEDGFNFLNNCEKSARDHDNMSMSFAGDDAPSVTFQSVQPFAVWRARAPGVPGQFSTMLHWIRQRGPTGRLVSTWAWNVADKVATTLKPGGEFEISVHTGATEAIHTRTPEGWHIALKAGQATSSIDLVMLPDAVSSTNQPVADADATETERVAPISIPDAPNVVRIDLAERQYVRTEMNWHEADRPAATTILSVANDALDIRVFAATGAINVPPSGAENQLDNERADVNADGLEVFIGPKPGAPWSASWLAVPANADEKTTFPSDQLRAARITATTPGDSAILCDWAPIEGETPFGWAMQLQIPLAQIPLQSDGSFALEIIVNERPADRVRRRGMLVLSGGGGFGYLRGDRADSSVAQTFQLARKYH